MFLHVEEASQHAERNRTPTNKGKRRRENAGQAEEWYCPSPISSSAGVILTRIIVADVRKQSEESTAKPKTKVVKTKLI